MNSISIIVATYNAGKYLQNCIDSIILQKDEKTELLIIDGGSKDNTIEIIKNNHQHITYWVSEPDKGIYDAWNKGIDRATGNWIMFLGADDKLVLDAIKCYTDFMDQNNVNGNIDFISSRVQMIDKNGNPVRIKGWSFEWPLFLKEMTVAHPGALHSKILFQLYGKFDIQYKIVGDYEFLLRPGVLLKTLFLNKVTAFMSEGGVSDSTSAIREYYKAVTITGEYPKHKALKNSIVVFLKFKIKNIARKLGLNLYLRKV